MKHKFIRDQTAEGFIDVAITILIIFTLMASLMALFPIFYGAAVIEPNGEVYGQNRRAIRKSGR